MANPYHALAKRYPTPAAYGGPLFATMQDQLS